MKLVQLSALGQLGMKLHVEKNKERINYRNYKLQGQKKKDVDAV
jgi:hypothetical protein